MDMIGLGIPNSSFKALCEFLGKDEHELTLIIDWLIKEDVNRVNKFLYEDLNKLMDEYDGNVKPKRAIEKSENEDDWE
jgi:hypothetical protein